MHLTNGEKTLKREEKNFIRKRALISKEERNTEQNIITNQTLKIEDFFRKAAYCPAKKRLQMLGIRRYRTLC